MLTKLFNKKNKRKILWAAVIAVNSLNIVHLIDNEEADTKRDFAASITTFAEEGHLGSASDHVYDADREDALNAVIDDIANTVFDDLTSYHGDLFADQDWNNVDRKRYERLLFTGVEQQINEIRALSSNAYRSEFFDESVTRHNSINALSPDIAAGTQNIEWDCEAQSLVAGLIANATEQKIFAHYTPSDNDTTSAFYGVHDYQYIVGYLNGYRGDNTGHAFLMSTATGAVIEATSESEHSAYLAPLDPSYSYADFVEGKGFMSQHGHVYTHEAIPIGDPIHDVLKQGLQEALSTSLRYSEQALTLLDQIQANPETELTLAQIQQYDILKATIGTAEHNPDHIPDFLHLMSTSYELLYEDYTVTIDGDTLSAGDLIDQAARTARNAALIARGATNIMNFANMHLFETALKSAQSNLIAIENHEASGLIAVHYGTVNEHGHAVDGYETMGETSRPIGLDYTINQLRHARSENVTQLIKATPTNR